MPWDWVTVWKQIAEAKREITDEDALGDFLLAQRADQSLQHRLGELKQKKADAEVKIRPAKNTWAYGIMKDIRFHLIRRLVKRTEEAMITKAKGHPLFDWFVGQPGIADRLAAEMCLAVDWNLPLNNIHGYLGLFPGAKRERGKKTKYNPQRRAIFKGRAILPLMTHSTHYKGIYDQAKEKYGSRETTKLHKHNMALQIMVKALIEDAWNHYHSSATVESRKATIASGG